MKIWLAVAMLSLLVSCNDKDIDGVMKVFKSFTLTDEDGYNLSISEGTYEAEFNYKSRKDAIELEIDAVVADYDRDFMFNIPDLSNAVVSYDLDTKTERMRIDLPSSATGQPVHAEVVISNKIISKKPPSVYWDRCSAYIGTQGGLSGLLGIAEQPDISGASGTGGLARHVYTVSSFTESQLSVAISIVDGEETVALFEGTENRRYRELHWAGKCGEYDRPVIRRD